MDESGHYGNLLIDKRCCKKAVARTFALCTFSSSRDDVSSNRNTLLARAATAVALVALGYMQWFLARPLKNDAFVDEATYIVSGQLLRESAMTGATTPPIASYLSGAPHLYPALASVLYDRGGLEAVRALSFACLIVAMLAVYATARQLFDNRVAGIAAALLFSLQAPVLFLGRFATYDAPSIALMALAVAFAVDRSERWRWNSAALAGICIGAASVLKYATLLYLPCIVLVAALVVPPPDRWKRGAITGIGAVAVAAALVALGQPRELLTGFVSTTLARSVTSGGRATDIIMFAAALGGVAALIALPALALASAAVRWAAIAIFASALLAPVNHVRLHEFVSLHKHMAFALVLFTALGGGSMAALIAWLGRRWERGQGVIAFAVGVAALAIGARAILRPGVDEAARLFRYWPDNTRTAYLSFKPVTSKTARFLSEEPDLGTLYLGKLAPVAQWVHPYYFDYDGQQARKPADVTPYRLAIRDGYFTAVLLRFGPQREWADAVEEELLRSQPRYRLAARLAFDLVDGPGAYQLWVRADAPGAEGVR